MLKEEHLQIVSEKIDSLTDEMTLVINEYRNDYADDEVIFALVKAKEQLSAALDAIYDAQENE